MKQNNQTLYAYTTPTKKGTAKSWGEVVHLVKNPDGSWKPGCRCQKVIMIDPSGYVPQVRSRGLGK